MSRNVAYTDDKIEVIVGYDSPFKSLFYQVWDKPLTQKMNDQERLYTECPQSVKDDEWIEDEDAIIKQDGANGIRKITTIVELEEELSDYCIIPRELKESLIEEMTKDADQPDSPVMKFMKERGILPDV
jgi:hypothetical protein